MSKSKGLGDTIEKITVATGIKKVITKINKGPCQACNKRQTYFNRKFPYRNQP